MLDKIHSPNIDVFLDNSKEQNIHFLPIDIGVINNHTSYFVFSEHFIFWEMFYHCTAIHQACPIHCSNFVLSFMSFTLQCFQLFVQLLSRKHLWFPGQFWHLFQRTSYYITWLFPLLTPCLLFSCHPYQLCFRVRFSTRWAMHEYWPNWPSFSHYQNFPSLLHRMPKWLLALLYNKFALSFWIFLDLPCPIFVLWHFYHWAEWYLFWNRCLSIINKVSKLQSLH